MKRRVVITGLGMVTPLGVNVTSNWKRLITGNSAVDFIELEGSLPLTIVGAKIRDFEPDRLIGKDKSLKRMSKATKYVIAAAKQAVEENKLDPYNINPERIGVYVGSGEAGCEPDVFFPGFDVSKGEKERINVKKFSSCGLQFIDPYFSLRSLPNAGLAFISIQNNAKGVNNNFVNSATASSQAIGEGFYAIQQGYADIIIVGGYDSLLNVSTFLAYKEKGILSCGKFEAKKGYRPFDKNRDGFILGEGAGVIILEELNSAKRRNTPIYAEIKGYACRWGPDPFLGFEKMGVEVLASTMESALKKGEILKEEVDYLCAHGDATILGDKIETKAIKKVFGNHSYKILINSIKPITGFLGAASGTVELISTILTMKEGIIPPTINYETVDVECDLNYVPNVPQEKKVRIALSINRGIGGQNTAVVIKKFEGT